MATSSMERHFPSDFGYGFRYRINTCAPYDDAPAIHDGGRFEMILMKQRGAYTREFPDPQAPITAPPQSRHLLRSGISEADARIKYESP